MHIAIIGLGEVGRCYVKALREVDDELSLCEIRPSAAATELAASCGRPIHEQTGAWLGQAELILSCVTGAVALSVIEQCLPHVRSRAPVADMTTASPDAKRRAAGLAQRAGVRYVDVAIMGGIALNGVRTPLLAAGDGAGEVKSAIERAGGRVQAIAGGAAGDAISLKILRSVFTKGMEALAVELLMNAERQGVREKLYEQLSDIDQTPLRSFLDMLVCTHVVHAERRAHEVHDAQRELATHGLPSLVLPGVERRFRATAEALARRAPEPAQPNVDQALQWLLASTADAQPPPSL